MKNIFTLRFLPALLALLLAAAPARAQVVVGRAAPTVEARKQVLREVLHLPANADLRPLETTPDPLGFMHEQFQLYYQGVKVEHGRLRVHSRAGKVESVSGETLRPAAGLSVQPGLSEAAALQRAMATIGARRYKWQLPAEEAALKQQTGKPNATYQPDGELVWVGDFRQPEASRPLVLAWKFNIYAHEPVSRAWYYVDAHSGQVVLRNAIIKHANAPGATFATRYVGPRTSITDNTGSDYRLRETATSRGVTTLNVRKGNSFATAIDFVDNDNNWTAAEHNNANFDNAALDAHLGAQATQGYWASIHGRDSYDDKGSVLLSYVHYDETPTTPAGTDNAYWNGTAMLYGDGNTLFKPLTAIDVCGHEIGHAVCDATADLVYANEPGAMNEGFSDIWGACVENYFDSAKQIWLIGEDITLPAAGAALRSMSNPNQFGQPDTYKGTNWYTGTGDDGGVHYNSGVLNYWFYLLSAGGSGTNDFGTSFSVTGISIAKAERIAYRAERFYLVSTSQYIDARKATIQAAIDLYGLGSAEATATAQAWRAVGVGTTSGALEAVPTISGFTATSGPVGTVVTITGTNLGATYKVTFNGTDASLATLISAGSVSVTVPAGATTGLISLTTPSGTAVSATNFTVSSPGPAPTITGYLPVAGQVQGGVVTIAGTNFTAASTVSFNGTAATGVTFNSASQLTVTVPAGATSGALTVTTANGTATAPTSFTVLPAITGLSVGSGAVGTAVTITGTSFTGALNVKFNGTYATAFTVVNATTITTTVPNGATTGPVTVRTPSGTATSPASFAVTPSLAFTSFSPAVGPIGTVVNIRGRGFTGTSAITFGGVNAPTYTVATDLEIWATVPAGAQTGDIVLTTPLGPATSPSVFTVDLGYPVVSSFSPTFGPVGTAVTITGNYFTGTTAVLFNGTTAAFSVVNNTTINATVPAGATTGPISVTNAAGTGTSTASFFLPPPNDLCTNALPLVCGSSVTGATVGATNTGDPTGACGGRTPSTSGGVFYQITGTGSPITLSACTGTTYDMVLFVYTGGCGSYTCVASDDDGCGNTNGGPSTLTFNSTNGTSYIVYVTGFNTAKGPFTLTTSCGAAPTISSFSPTGGASGTVVSITGTNFTGATAVRFNGTAAATFSVTNATTISATAPAGVTTGPISVTTPGGTATSATNFVAPPTVSSFTPTIGPVGTSVTVTGTGFVGVTAVRFNGTAATTSSVVNATTLTATVPAGATTGPISVVNAAGTGTSSTNYTVGAPMMVSSLNPARNAKAVAPTTSAGITFNQSVDAATAGNARMYSPQRGGQLVRGGNATASGATLTINPANDLKPGETVQVTVPATVASSAGFSARPHVYQFTAAAGGTGSFSGGSDFATGNTPIGVAAADVDGDGDLDLLTANFVDGTVSVRLNNGSGTYSGTQTVTVGNKPYDVVMADVDGDGDLDFLTSNFGASTVSVRLNGGDATGSNTGLFSGGSTVSVGANCYNTAVGDVDGDGDLDFVTTSYSNSATTVSVRLNNGSGTFTAGSPVSVGNGGGYVALGDVDGDGDLDLLTANYDANSVSVRLNGGDATGSNTGTFSGGSNPGVGTGPFSVVLGDVDGDGDLDFISTNGVANTVSVGLNNGSGTFAVGPAVGVGTGPVNAVLADVNGDGHLDIVTANFGAGANSASVLLNNGTGTFAGTTNVAVGTKPYGVALADVDGDGDLDLLTANTDDGGTTGGGVSVRFNSNPPPTISSITPNIGVPGSVLTLTGTNLTGTTSIAFTGSAGVKVVSTGFTVLNNTTITGVVVPAGAQSGPVRATTPSGTSAVGSVFFSRAKTVAAGGIHTLAIRADGTLWAWGSNPNGQLGTGNTTGSSMPIQVGAATSWVSVAAGHDHSLAIRADGTLWAWGLSTNGQLGLGNTTQQTSPQQVGAATNWVSVAAGISHSVAVRADGTLYTWGLNANGQLGLGHTTQQTSPQQVPGTTWVSAAAGNGHTAAVRTNGTLWAWGRNDIGQLGQGNNTQQTSPVQTGTATTWASVTTGTDFTLALRTDGTLWNWGYNDSYRLGQGNTTNLNTPTQVGTLTSWASAAAGYAHSAAVRADGTLWSWGYNVYGQLGTGNTTDQSTPAQTGTATSWTGAVATGEWHTVAEQSCPAVWAWGIGGSGQIGDGAGAQRNSPVPVFNNIRLTSFAPTSAAAGTSVAVTGLGLSGLTALTVNGANAFASVTNLSDTGFTFVVPAGATLGAGTVSVTAGCGPARSTGFTVLSTMPTLTGLNPTSGAAGTTVALTGTNLTGATSVSVNGVAVVPTNVLAGSLSFVVPAGGSNTQSITVTTGAGTSAASTAFTVLLRSGVAGTLPAVNAVAAARPNSAVALGFSEPVAGTSLGTSRVFSAQAGGRKAGTWTTSGSTAGFASTLGASLRDFRPGEVVSVSMPATVLSAGGLTTPKRVYQFTTATGGTGRGNFGGTSDLSGGNFVTCVALGDITGDGRPDLLWVNYGTNTVGMAPGLSAGGFGSISTATVGNNPITLALGDFNGDGALDFVTVNYGIPSGSGTTLSVGLNGGTGTFTVSALTTGTGPRGIAVGDVDGDGDLDLLVPIGSGVQVFGNNGSGSFTLASTIAGINFATNIAAGDVDGDGDLDLLTANYFQANTVSLRLNDGNGTFTAPTNTPEIPVGVQPYNLSVGDLDGDGDLDLLSSGTPGVSVRFNNGSGVFSAPAIAANGEVALPAGAANVALGDVDADGDLDFIASGAVRLNNGSGVFSAPTANATVPDVSNYVALADLDNDGDLDVAAATGSSTGSTAALVRMNQAAAPLPVELAVFTAVAKAPNVQLSWRTASEKSSARFEVERSLEGQQFSKIGELAAQGTKTSPTNYDYLDNQVPKTLSPQSPLYYRLRQVDLDGTASYSPVRVVTLGGKPALALFPNPTTGAAVLTGAGPGMLVRVLDALGREVAAATADAAGTATLVLPPGLASGVYLVRSEAATLRLTLE